MIAMITHCETHISPSSKLSCSPSVTAFDASLNQCVKNFKDLVTEYEQVMTELESCRDALSKQNDMCESKTCSAAEFLQKDIVHKENIIQAVACALIQLNETRNWSHIDHIFTLLYGEKTTTPPKHASNISKQLDQVFVKNTPLKTDTKTPNKKIKKEKLTPMKETLTPKKRTSPKKGLRLRLIIENSNPTKKEDIPKDLSASLEDVSFKDESMSEIDETPRAKSPIFENKKRKNTLVNVTNSLFLSNSDSSDGAKRKGPEAWQQPEAKHKKLAIVTTPCSSKLKTSTPSTKKRVIQSRLSTVLLRNDDVVDLTSSPEFSGGIRGDNKGPVKTLIKTESNENEETIFPSPTSNPTDEFNMFKSAKEKDCQSKFKRPLSLKHKDDLLADHKGDTINLKNNLKDETKYSEFHPKGLNEQKDLENCVNDIGNVEFQSSLVVSYATNKKKESKCGDLETSVNILNPKRFKSPKKSPPKPVQTDVEPNIDCDVTHCDSFNHIEEVKENCNQENKTSTLLVTGVISPTKRPLVENSNVANVPQEADSSMSLLARGAGEVKRKTPDKMEPVYKEPTVRKKAEKMALPAWLCEQCKQFTDALYEDLDGEKAKAIIQACGKHRGRNNPIRPKTPPGFWEVRWDVPEDTEEFNRRNNAK